MRVATQESYCFHVPRGLLLRNTRVDILHALDNVALNEHLHRSSAIKHECMHALTVHTPLVRVCGMDVVLVITAKLRSSL